MKRRYILIPLWIATSIWNAGALNASSRAEYFYPRLDERDRIQTRTFNVFMGMLPQAIVAAPFETDFYHDGWSLSVAPVEVKPQ